MAKLSKAEAAMLKRLTDKSEAPDAPAVARTLNVTVDLSDPKQVAEAVKFGLLNGAGDDDGGDEDDDDADEPPVRRSFFKE
jgi:hypothetical protein